MRAQAFPKPSRYARASTGGSNRMVASFKRSRCLEGCTSSASSIGVGCGQSKVRLKPACIFIVFPELVSLHATMIVVSSSPRLRDGRRHLLGGHVDYDTHAKLVRGPPVVCSRHRDCLTRVARHGHAD